MSRGIFEMLILEFKYFGIYSDVKSEIIIIGDEILIGQIVDTNSSFLGKKLADLGAPVSRITKVGDEEIDIVHAFQEAATRVDFVVTCGGLGPTSDDRTRYAVAKCLQDELKQSDEALAEIASYYQKAGRIMGESNHIQAMIPVGADYLPNARGTAPGLRFRLDSADFFCLQGVPKEMEWMSETYVFPFVNSKTQGGSVLKFRLLRTTGIPESSLYEKIAALIKKYDGVLEIAFLPQLSRGVDVRITVRNQLQLKAREILDRAEKEFRTEIEKHYPFAIYAMGENNFDEVLAQLFFDYHLTIATAESCTGGLIGHRLTNVSGSSRYFMRGVVTYSNESKAELLDVPAALIEKHGAVSEEVARVMADAIRRKASTNIGLAVTGIAGPTGGTEEKPIGLAYVGLSTAEGTQTFKLQPLPYRHDRISFKERLAQFALDAVRKNILTRKS